MASDFPVDGNNLSFSDEEDNSIFIMQSTFLDVNTQQVDDAIDFFSGDLAISKSLDVQDKDLNNILDEHDDEMCEKVFDFLEDTDNGWSVSS